MSFDKHFLPLELYCKDKKTLGKDDELACLRIIL